MRKSLKYTSLSLIAGMLSFTSCGDGFLDQIPDERVELSNVDDVVMLLSSAYSTGNYGWLCELSSDNIIDINAPYLATQSNGNEVLVHYNLNSYERADDEAFRFEPVKSSTDSDSPSSIWDGCYNAIATVNHALEMLDKITADHGGEMDAKTKAAYGEAYLSRAYHHFILVNVFSQAYKDEELSKNDVGIPYITTPEDVVMVHYDRRNVTETYKSIEEDLLKGLELINDVNYKKPKWHFNEAAAKAFAVRFYLYKRDYDKVIKYADELLGTEYGETLLNKLQSYANFDDCTTGTDYAEVWQGPDNPNNLMLIATHSIQFRRHVGHRYSCAGKALRDIEFHLGPNWRWYLMPAASVGGGTFWDGVQDHGFTSSKIIERFEYTDKVAGIGYAHLIRREFTNNEVLLSRAEARLLGKGDIDGCCQDLIAYEDSRQSFSESNKAFYTSGKALQPLTRDMIDSYYSPDARILASNCFADWNFTQNMSPNFVIPAEYVTYMNAVNDMRRYDLSYTGLRFFDLKRWGIEYSHFYSIDNIEYKLTSTDPRRAIEAPQEVLGAGLEPSQPAQVTRTPSYSRSTSSLLKTY